VYEAQGKYEQALAEYDRVVALVPESPIVYGNRGDVHFALREYDAALADFRQLTTLDPKSSVGDRRCGDVYLSKSEFDEAVACYQRALAKDAMDADAHNGLGRVKEGQEKYRDALAHYDEALRLRPRSAFFHSDRGSVLLSLSAYDWAAQAYGAALELEPANPTAQQGKADALRLWADEIDVPGMMLQALDAADKAVALSGVDPAAHAVRASVLVSLGRYDEAVAAFDEALRLDATYAWARKEKTKALYHQGAFDKALAALEELARMHPELGPDAFTGQVLVFRGLNRRVDAEHALSKALNSGSDAEAHLRQGRRFVEFRAWEDASTSFREAIRGNSNLADAHNELAWFDAIELGRDLEECTVHAMLAVEFGAENSIRGNYLDTLGWIWFKRGDLDEAQECLEEAVQLVEPDILIRHHLKVVQEALRSAPGPPREP
jgi:tetratricopeptide (TPR) repeat protein